MMEETTYQWKPVSAPASAVIALMRAHRSDVLEIVFHYADGIYHVGVNPACTREPFFMDDQTYPSMFAFCSSACIEGGFLLPDLQQNLDVLAVNQEDPAAYFSN